MPPKKNVPEKKERIIDLMRPSALILSSDAVNAVDGSMTYVRVIDQLVWPRVPMAPCPFWLTAEVGRHAAIKVQQLIEMQIGFHIQLVNPEGAITHLVGPLPPNPPQDDQDWWTFRIIVNFNGGLAFAKFGQYKFQLCGQIKDEPMEILTERYFNIIQGESQHQQLQILEPNMST